jgi:hypothetical protein
VKDLNTQRGGHRTDTGVETPADRMGVEADGCDVSDALRGRQLSDDQVRAAPRHQPVDLASNQRRHVGFPPKPVPLALDSNGLRSGLLRGARGLYERAGDVRRHGEQHYVCVLRRSSAAFLVNQLRATTTASPGAIVTEREYMHAS